jgi:murein L,D-transpeptidase YcbB/YkuD
MTAVACRSEGNREAAFDRAVRDEIAVRLGRIEIPPTVCVAEDLLQASAEVAEFYRRRDFSPGWSRGGKLTSKTRDLLQAVRAAPEEGLRASDYHPAAVEASLRKMGLAEADPDRTTRIKLFSDLDLLFTDAFLLYASHLAEGKVEANKEKPRWTGSSARVDLVGLLDRALAEGAIEPSLEALKPQHRYYARLKSALADYSRMAERGGWPRMPAGATLSPGDRGARVTALWTRLGAEGFLLDSGSGSEDVFDDRVTAAVCAFQARHGLPQTGIVGRATAEALNVPVEDRIETIRANLERWRWLSRDFGARYAFVDAAAFEMFVMKDAQEVLRMKIVAGTPTWQTPVFSSRLTEVVVNPGWNAPPSILVRELVAYIKSDPDYLLRNKMKLLRGWGPDAAEVDVRTLDFEALTKENLDFRLYQMPGPLNILGRLKFTHPNRYNVFLHDTPYQADFELERRSASHGCVRIAKPVDFAVFLLEEPGRWNPQAIQELIDTEEEKVFKLTGAVRAHVFYGTAWAEEDGTVSFRPDIYFLDEALASALDSPPPRMRRPERVEFKDEVGVSEEARR